MPGRKRSEWLPAFSRKAGEKTAEEWALELGMKVASVRSTASREGVFLRGARLPADPAQEVRVREMWGTLPPVEIARLEGVPPKRLYAWAKAWGLKIERPHHKAEDILRAAAASRVSHLGKITGELAIRWSHWTSENAYVFGVLWADGFLTPQGIGLEVSPRDREWVGMLGRWIAPKVSVVDEPTRKKYGWRWSSVVAREHFLGMGLFPRKSFIDPPYPQVPDEFFSHFARGVLDGDGSPTSSALRWYGSPQFMRGFRRQALSCWEGVSPHRLLRHGKLMAFQWGVVKDVVRILQFLYGDCGDFFLPRKRDKLENYLAFVLAGRAESLEPGSVVSSEERRQIQTLLGGFQYVDGRGRPRVPNRNEVEHVRNLYRKIGFPYPELTPGEKMSRRRKFSRCPTEGLLNRWTRVVRSSNAGVELATAFHPHIYRDHLRGQRSALEAFENDTYLRKAIKVQGRKGSVSRTRIREGLRSFSHRPTNFPPLVARALYEEFLPPGGGRVLDPCCGYGGRLLGAMESPWVLEYVGLDPSEQSIAGNRRLLADLYPDGEHKAILVETCAEDWNPEDRRGSFNLILTSPPYRDHEIYGLGETQVAHRFATEAGYESWAEQVSRVWWGLALPGARLVLVVSDPFLTKTSRLSVVEPWRRALPRANWVLEPEWRLEFRGRHSEGDSYAGETVLVARKPFCGLQGPSHSGLQDGR